MSPGSEEASARRHQGRDRKYSPQTAASESQTITPTGKSKRIFKREQMMPNTSGSILLLRCQICGYRRDVAKWGHLLSSRSFLGASQGFSFRKRRGSFFFESCVHDPWDVAGVWLTCALLAVWRYKIIAARHRRVIIHFSGKGARILTFWNMLCFHIQALNVLNDFDLVWYLHVLSIFYLCFQMLHF